MIRTTNSVKPATKKKSIFKGKMFKNAFSNLGRVGKSLLFPIATLPIAAILMRIGAAIPAEDSFSTFVHTITYWSGNVVFKNLHIIFAVGIAFGMAKDNRGEAAMAGFIGIALMTMLLGSNYGDLTNIFYKHANIGRVDYAVQNAEGFHRVFTTIKNDAYDDILSNNVLTGIIAGSLVAWIYNKFNGVELPSVLGFFSGRRLVPVMTILSLMLFAIAYALIFPWVGYGLYKFSENMSSATGNRYGNAAIMGTFGFINRILLPFGLHHIPNTLFWFTLPVFDNSASPDIIQDASGNPVSGDIFAFLNGVPEHNPAGTFQTGFFPIMMFGLPAMVAVFYNFAEDKEQKRRVLSIFGSAALVSFITGITEPIEFAFLFISPALFFTHAVLTGIFGFITGLFGIQLGFGFSAGFIDYLLSIPKSFEIIDANKAGFDAAFANPLWIFWIGAVTALTYYFVGSFLVKRWNVPTPGRGSNLLGKQVEETVKVGEISTKAKMIVTGLGGWSNITSYQNCATRLRYDLRDSKLVNKAMIKRAGAIDTMIVSDTHVQVIVGPTVEILNEEISTNRGADLTFKDQLKQKEEVLNITTKSVNVKSVVGGKVEGLETLKDGVFSNGILGKGVVVRLDKKVNKQTIASPMAGIVTVAFPTKHAYGITTEDGVEVLVHIGLDTVELKGKGFKQLVKVGQEIKAGTPLAEIDLKTITDAGKIADPIVVVTSGQPLTKVASGKIKKGDALFTIK